MAEGTGAVGQRVHGGRGCSGACGAVGQRVQWGRRCIVGVKSKVKSDCEQLMIIADNC